MLVIVEISDHLEGPRFDLLLFDHLLKHIGREILLDALGATLELKWHHHVPQLPPGALYVASEDPGELFVHIETCVTHPVVEEAILGQKTFRTPQDDVG